MLIKVGDEKILNLNYIFLISLEECKGKYRWSFISAISDDIIYSPSFNTIKEAKKWLEKKLKEGINLSPNPSPNLK